MIDGGEGIRAEGGDVRTRALEEEEKNKKRKVKKAGRKG